MLQIISGKLFTREPEHRNELRSILYTNLRVVREKPIETAAGRLMPVNTLHHSRAVVYEVTELIEAQPRGPGVLVSHGAEPYSRDFATIVSFALNVTCTPDPNLAERLTSGHRGVAVFNAPSKLVRRVFDAEVWCQDADATRLTDFVAQLIGLERRSYLAAMRAMRTYVTGLHRLADDLELAYTLLVASVESLAQGFDGHRATWADYDEAKRSVIDNALQGADGRLAEKVRLALLQIEHVSLARRFRDFTLAHLHPTFFRQEADGQLSPVGRAELTGALQEAYRLRSKYVHNLHELPRALTVGPEGSETARIGGATMLTFQGLTRLARHIIAEFVQRQPKVETEVYDYRLEPPSIVQVHLAPEYWVGHAAGLTPDMGLSRLEGFLEQIAAHLQHVPNAKVTDLREVLSKVETMLPTMNVAQRRPYVALYLLFNYLAPETVRMPNFETVRGRYGPDLDEPSVESLITHLVLSIPLDWPLSDNRKAHDDYFRRRDRKNGVKIHRVLEAGLSLSLAERCRAAGDMVQARQLIGHAVENFPGHVPLRDLEGSFDGASTIDWKAAVLPQPTG